MTHVSLFSGIGGDSLAAQWAGFRTIQFVERDPFCQKVLAKNFPGVPIHDDITTFDGRHFSGTVDLISGGFPCQDISRANRFAIGIDGDRSGLWRHMHRIIAETRPAWVVAENSPSLLDRGYDRVGSDLLDCGYTSWPVVLEAGDVGALQKSERVFIVASLDQVGSRSKVVQEREDKVQANKRWCAKKVEPGRHHIVLRPDTNDCIALQPDGGYMVAPVVCGCVHGVPDRLDRLRALGNAIVPQQVYPILQAIADHIQGEAA